MTFKERITISYNSQWNRQDSVVELYNSEKLNQSTNLLNQETI